MPESPTRTPPVPTPDSTPTIHELEAQRRANRDAAAALGFAPYGGRTTGLTDLAVAKSKYDPVADAARQAQGREPTGPDPRPVAHVAGRIVLHRDNGKLVWMNLRDHTGDLQVAVSQRDCDEKGFQLAKILDMGDIITVKGPLMKTKTGEVTVWASSVSIACKSLFPPPEKHAGLTDPELRYRRRYIDLYTNPETMGVFKTRSLMISAIRKFFDSRGFLEVDTPVLQALAGGAAARPFTTHLNALDIDLFLRVAPELHLKRLLVGGLPRVYEIARNFRNEGVDKTHNPEFAMVEIYEAFADYSVMREYTEGLVRELARIAHAELFAGESGPDGSLVIPFGDYRIDYAKPFEVVTYGELFEKALGFPMTDARRARDEAKKRGLKHEGLDDALVINELFEEFGEKAIDPSRPTFVLDFPAAISPLTRPKPDNPALADRFELFIAGFELANAYTELNDPDIQEAKFREQLAGIDDEHSTFRTFDQDFIDALKVGMPPAGGLGIGVDRLVMLLTNQRSIRDVLLFPFMRPEA